MLPFDYTIHSNQTDIHQDLAKVLERHVAHPFQKPIPKHQHACFETAKRWVLTQNKPIILDSGCGTGMSTGILALQHPEYCVLGIDKSQHRLEKSATLPENAFLLHADLIDQWRLIHQAQWDIQKHFILYPNPWPKSADLKKRFHGHPVFPFLISLSPYLEIRSNWKLYLKEFEFACHSMGMKTELVEYIPEISMTLFEKKYLENQQTLSALKIYG